MTCQISLSLRTRARITQPSEPLILPSDFCMRDRSLAGPRGDFSAQVEEDPAAFGHSRCQQTRRSPVSDGPHPSRPLPRKTLEMRKSTVFGPSITDCMSGISVGIDYLFWSCGSLFLTNSAVLSSPSSSNLCFGELQLRYVRRSCRAWGADEGGLPLDIPLSRGCCHCG